MTNRFSLRTFLFRFLSAVVGPIRRTFGYCKMEVSCSACADWPRALLQTHEAPGVFPNAGSAVMTPAPSDTSETHAHTARLPGHGAALSQLRATRALASPSPSSSYHFTLQGAERKQLTSGRIFFVPAQLPLSPPRSPAPRWGSELKLSFTAKIQSLGFFLPRFHDQSISIFVLVELARDKANIHTRGSNHGTQGLRWRSTSRRRGMRLAKPLS